MRLDPKQFLASLGVAALTLAPLTVTTASVALISADAAYAKGNGGERGGERGERGERGGGRGGEKSERGNSDRGNRGGEARSGGNRNAPAAVVRSNRGGQSAGGQGQARRAAPSEQRGGARASRGGNGNGNGNGSATVREAKASGMHPSQLGNMNGALNANINAVLAHIRNGNTNGPVGHLAALAVADAGAAAAREYLGSPGAGEYLALRDALSAAGYESLADYEAAVAADPANAVAEVDAAIDGIGQTALNDALADAGYSDLAEYEAAVAADAEAADPAIDAALGALGEVDNTAFDRITEAEADLEAVSAAEQAMLDYWNKNGDADPATVTPEEQALLDALHARLEGHGDAIAGAIAASATHGSGDDDGTSEDPEDDYEDVDNNEDAAVLLVPPAE